MKESFRKPLNVWCYFIIFILLLIMPLICFAQSIESAREKYNLGDYNSAEKELKAILAEEGENIEAQALLEKVEKAKNKERSRLLTEKAIVDIDNYDFESAYKFLKEAIILDPENQKARDLYLSIYEIVEIEEKSIEESIAKEELLPLKEKEKVVTEKQLVEIAKASVEETTPEQKPQIQKPQGEEIGETKPESAVVKQNESEMGRVKTPEKPAAEKSSKKIIKEITEPEELPTPPIKTEKVHYIPGKGDRAFIRIATTYTMARSNYLDYIDSDVSILGGIIDIYYYFKLFKARFGVSCDYSSSFIKLSGNENINFMIHKINTSLLFRYFLFDDGVNRLTFGLCPGYSLFILGNKMEFGVYKFTRVYGPSFGLFLSDPLIYRFIKKDFFKDIGFEGKTKYLFLFQKGAPHTLEFYVGVYYNIGNYRIGIGYRNYSIKNPEARESYNDIQLSTGYRF